MKVILLLAVSIILLITVAVLFLTPDRDTILMPEIRDITTKRHIANKDCKLVGHFPLFTYDALWREELFFAVKSTLPGFVVREGNNVFTLREWKTGRVLWRVTSAVPNRVGWIQGTPISPLSWDVGISEDGHVFAVMTAAGAKARIQTWRDGKPIGTAFISMTDISGQTSETKSSRGGVSLWHTEITVLPEGRCILAIQYNPFSSGVSYHTLSAVIEGNQVIATDHRDGEMRFSADGTTAVCDNILNHVFIKNRKIEFKQAVQIQKDFLYPGADGIAVTPGGYFYRVTNKPYHFRGEWQGGVMSANGHFAVLTQDKRARLVTMKTGKYWETRIPENTSTDVVATEDGQHIVVEYRVITEEVRDDRDYLYLYQSPGDLAARLRTDPYNPDDWCVSPDGRYLVIASSDRGCLSRIIHEGADTPACSRPAPPVTTDFAGHQHFFAPSLVCVTAG